MTSRQERLICSDRSVKLKIFKAGRVSHVPAFFESNRKKKVKEKRKRLRKMRSLFFFRKSSWHFPKCRSHKTRENVPHSATENENLMTLTLLRVIAPQARPKHRYTDALVEPAFLEISVLLQFSAHISVNDRSDLVTGIQKIAQRSIMI